MSLAERPAEEGVRRAALACLDQALEAGARLAPAREGEEDRSDGAVHALRVAVRRLRSTLLAYEDVFAPGVARKARRRLRRLVARTGPGRDAEVRLAWIDRLGAEVTDAERAGVAWLRERVAKERDAAYDGIHQDLARGLRKVDKRVREPLSTYTVTFVLGREDPRQSFGALAAAAVERELEGLVEALEPVKTDDDVAVAHVARLRGKALRYVIEPFRGEMEIAKNVVSRLKALQDLLGDLHDLDALAALAGAALEETALAQARHLRAAAEEGHVAEALESDERAGLVTLLARVATERAARLSTLRTAWLSEGGELLGLAASARALAAELAGPTLPVEIERKYLLRGVPARCRELTPTAIDQGYVPGRAIVERLRRTARDGRERFVRTIKVGKGLSRIELEEECSREIFCALWSLTEGRRVRKQRFVIEDGGFVFEIDEFLDRDLVLAEVELPTEDTEVVIPDWLERALVREVTEEPAYLNLNLAR